MAGETLFSLPENFYTQYWQRKPLVIRGALPGYHSPLTPDELAGLACVDGVEARIVMEHGTTIPWEVLYGPFDETTFASLPERAWTLLVQAVDHWDDDVATLRRLFPAIPNWRVDDVMVSYAVDGGSVGPHFDQYDVFLLQGMGTRRWHLGGRASDGHEFLSDTELRLLADFRTSEEFILRAGDALYLPPGEAHWGIAEGECMTYSIGFRAPSESEIIDAFAAETVQRLGEEQRYRDPSAAMNGQPHSGELTEDVIDRVHEILSKHIASENIARWFGAAITEPKYAKSEIPNDSAADLARLNSGAVGRACNSSRFAFYVHDHGLELYVDGVCIECPLELLPLISSLCDGLPFSPIENAAAQSLLLKLLQRGAIVLDSA